MQRDNDPEMRAMADAEWPEVRARIDALEAELQGYLVPKDPLDNNNVFLEIRAGTGGDEAAIFAGDLHRMYSKYARSEEHTSELQSLMRSSYAVFCLKNKKKKRHDYTQYCDIQKLVLPENR